MASKTRRDKKNRILNKGEMQLPDGRYVYRYTDMYNKRHKVYSWKLEITDKTPAGTRSKKSLRELEKEIEDKLKNKIDTFASQSATLNSQWDIYFESKTLKTSTRNNYDFLWKRYVQDTLGQLTIPEITPDIIARHYGELYKESCLALSTVSSVHSLIYAVFEKCIQNRLITYNPAIHALDEIRKEETERQRVAAAKKGGKTKKREKEQNKDQQERVALSPEQEQAFLNFIATDERCKKWKNIFAILLYTGLRISELCGITKDDIDLDQGVLYVERNLLYGKPEGEPKARRYVTSTKSTSSDREIPIYCDELKIALAEELAQYEDDGRVIDDVAGWVFRTRDGKSPLIENNCNDGLRRVLRDYNDSVEDKALRIHDVSCHNFRHTFATKCRRNQVALQAITYLMGHSPGKAITARYLHEHFEYARNELRKLANND